MTGKYIEVTINNDNCVVDLNGQHKICYDQMHEVSWKNEELEIAAIIMMMGLNIGQTWRYNKSGRTYFTYFYAEMNKLGMKPIESKEKSTDILLNGFEWDKLKLIKGKEHEKMEDKQEIERLKKINENLLLTNNNLGIEINRIKNSEALLIEENAELKTQISVLSGNLDEHEELKNWLEELKEIKKNNIKCAMKIITDELKKDKSGGSYYYSWQANLSMKIYDNSALDIDKCNYIAKIFLDYLIQCEEE